MPDTSTSYSYMAYDARFAFANNNGQAVTAAGLLSNGTVTPINVPGSSQTAVQGLTDSGLVYGFETPTGSSSVFSFTFDGSRYSTFQIRSDFVYPAPGSSATPFYPITTGIDAGGDVAGYYYYIGRSYGRTSFFYKNSMAFEIAPPIDYQPIKGSPAASPFTTVSGISASGTVFGSFENDKTAQTGSGPFIGFTYVNGVYTRILPPVTSSYLASAVRAINASGVIAGVYDAYEDGYQQHGFIDTAGTFTLLDAPGAAQTIVEGENDAGYVFGYNTTETVTNPKTSQGFLYQDGVYTTIAPVGAISVAIRGVTATGRVTGNYTDSAGQTHGFTATVSATGSSTTNNQTFTVGVNQSIAVNGYGDTVNATGAGAAVTIGGDGQYASDADDDVVQFGAGGTAAVTDASRVELFGDGVMASIGANDTVGFYGRGGHLTASGAGDHVFVGTNGQFASDADDNFITFAQGGAVSMFNDAREDVFGSGVTVDVGANDTIGLYGSGNTLTASGGGDAVWIGGNGRDASLAQDNVVTFLQGGTVTVLDDSRAELSGDGMTVLVGANDLIGVSGRGVNVTVNGAGSGLFIGGNGQTGADGDVDRVGFTQGGLAIVNDQSRVTVGGDGVGVRVGSNDIVTLTGAGDNVTMTGIGGIVQVGTGGGQLLIAGTGADTFGFGAGFGQDVVQNFQATGDSHDTLAFDHGVFASVSAILQASTQVGADVVITAGPNDVVRLQSVSLAALSSSNLKVT